MANALIYTRNALADAGVSLKNGTGGGAPALEQNADWPMSHLLIADRETYWRTSAAPPNPVMVDIDLGSAQSIHTALITKIRTYGGLENPSTTIRHIAGAGAYDPNPGAWTADSGGVGGNAHNISLFAGVPTTARYWRFEIASVREFSCNLWLIKTADVIDLGHDFSVGTTRSATRLRSEVTTPTGLTYAFEPAQDRGSIVFAGNLLLIGTTEATRDLLRDQLTTLESRFFLKLGDSTLLETSLPRGELSWDRVFAAPELFDFAIPVVEHP